MAAALFQGWLDLQAREGARLTYDQLAERLAKRMGTAPVTKAAMSQWFRGTREPDIRTFVHLCFTLGLDPVAVAMADRPGPSEGAGEAAEVAASRRRRSGRKRA